MSEHLEHDVVSWSGRSVEGYTDMAIVIELDEIMEDRGVSLNKLSHRVGITNVNLSRIKTGKVRAVRFSTLAAICDALECQPGDILKNVLRQDAGLMNAPATLLEQHPGACYNARQSVPRPPGQHRLTD